jgi:hypothetical protein
MSMSDEVNLVELNDTEAKDALGILDRTIGRQRDAEETPFILVSDAMVVLIDAYGVTQEQIAKYYRRTQPTISNYYSLRNLIDELKQAALNGQLKTFRAALWLSKMPEDVQREVYNSTGEGEIITQKAVAARKKLLKSATIIAFGDVDIPDDVPDLLPPGRIELAPHSLKTLRETGEVRVSVGARVYIITVKFDKAQQ